MNWQIFHHFIICALKHILLCASNSPCILILLCCLQDPKYAFSVCVGHFLHAFIVMNIIACLTNFTDSKKSPPSLTSKLIKT